jgi:Icc-related predicted phosphoesterase
MTRVSTILCAAEPHGSKAAIEHLIRAVDDHTPDAIALVGDLGAGAGLPALLRTLVRIGRPAYWVPGPGDAPLTAYMREALAIERTHPMLHGVHGTAAFDPAGHLVIAGLGGEILDAPEGERDEHTRLRYPRIEAEYRLKLLDTFGEHDRILLFWTRPAHKQLDPRGSEAVTELVQTYRPRLTVCAGPRGSERLGTSLVVAPGSLADGQYALVDLRSDHVEFAELPLAASR